MITNQNLEWLARALYYYHPESKVEGQHQAMKILNQAICKARPVWEGKEPPLPLIHETEPTPSPVSSQPTGAIDWSDPYCKISKYFTVGEATKMCTRNPDTQELKDNIVELAKLMDPHREAWGSPWGVTSWYRPPEVNAAVGGARNSQHLYGKAADVYPTNGNIAEFERWIDDRWSMALGYGARKGFVHLDSRAGGIRWNY